MGNFCSSYRDVVERGEAREIANASAAARPAPAAARPAGARLAAARHAAVAAPAPAPAAAPAEKAPAPAEKMPAVPAAPALPEPPRVRVATTRLTFEEAAWFSEMGSDEYVRSCDNTDDKIVAQAAMRGVDICRKLPTNELMLVMRGRGISHLTGSDLAGFIRSSGFGENFEIAGIPQIKLSCVRIRSRDDAVMCEFATAATAKSQTIYPSLATSDGDVAVSRVNGRKDTTIIYNRVSGVDTWYSPIYRRSNYGLHEEESTTIGRSGDRPARVTRTPRGAFIERFAEGLVNGDEPPAVVGPGIVVRAADGLLDSGPECDRPALVATDIRTGATTTVYAIHGRAHRRNGPAIIVAGGGKPTREAAFIQGVRVESPGGSPAPSAAGAGRRDDLDDLARSLARADARMDTTKHNIYDAFSGLRMLSTGLHLREREPTLGSFIRDHIQAYSEAPPAPAAAPAPTPSAPEYPPAPAPAQNLEAPAGSLPPPPPPVKSADENA